MPDCTISPTGRHQVDTSMESGPNNCFYCEADMRGYAPTITRPAPEYAGLAERLGDAELQRLLKDLTPYREKTIGSLRIDMGEVRKICRAVEVCDEAATALTALTERNKALEAEVERLREAAAAVLHDWHSDTGFVESVRLTTGRPWPWYHGEKSVADLRAALGDRP